MDFLYKCPTQQIHLSEYTAVMIKPQRVLSSDDEKSKVISIMEPSGMLYLVGGHG